MKLSTPQAIALVIATVTSGCAGERRSWTLTPPEKPAVIPAAAPVAATTSPAADPPVEIPDCQTAETETGAGAIPGILVADRKAAIGSQLTGEVAAVLVQEGDHVQAHQPVIRLDDRALHLEVAAAAAALETARRRLVSGATGTRVTANEVDQLVTQAHGDRQTALAKRDAARAGLDSATRESAAEIAAARAQLEVAQMRLARLRNGSRPQEVAAARSGVVAVEAQLTRAASEANRIRDLARQGAVSEQALVAATSEQQRLQAEVAHSRQQLALLEEGTRSEEIREAEAQQRAAEAQLHLAESSRQRVDQRRSELAAAQAQVEQYQAALRVARASHVRVNRSRQDADSLAGDVQSATANLALAREHLSQALLLSPISGQVIHRHVQPGDSVTADQRILLEVIDPSSLHVEISVSETELSRLYLGAPVRVALPSLSTKRLPGRVESLGEAPRGTAPGYVGRVRLAHLPKQARAGMLANVYRIGEP